MTMSKSVASSKTRLFIHRPPNQVHLIYPIKDTVKQNVESERKRIPIIILLLCVLGASFQCYDITKEYMRYDVVSMLSILKPAILRPPALTVCMGYVDLVDWKKLLPGRTFGKELWQRDIIQALQESVSIADMFKALPDVTSEPILRYKMSRKLNSYAILEDANSLAIFRFIKNYYACYSFSMPGRHNVTLKSRHVTYGQEPGSLFRVSFAKANLSSVTRAVFYLNPSEYIPRGDRDFRLNVDARGVRVFSQRATYWSLSYQQIDLHLLPPPYITKCQDFHHLGFEGSYHCQLSCTHALAMATYGKSLFTISHTEPQNFTVINKYTIIRNETLGDEVERWELLCDRKCAGMPCHKRLYSPKIDSQMDSETEIVFRIVEPSFVFVKSEFVPKTSATVCTVSVLSTLGVWLSFSFFAVIRKTYRHGKLYFSKFRTQSN
ncbi:hypothetical protein HDE_06619 [Halotydeus destructor]|nr:hypothetical protein HDE_06619 [Halotydeus destructor]